MIGFLGGLRFLWAQLITMRTALVLLFLLALAAVPGSLVPQQNISPVRVKTFLQQHKTLGPIYDKAGLFDVYTSPWFSAIYILLFISLIGCIIPRIRVYLRAVRARPPRTPRHLHRLPAYASVDLPESEPDQTASDNEAVIAQLRDNLRARRYRVARHPDGSLAAERGYLREAGNLVFHISLVFLLVGVAVVWLTNFRGDRALVVGGNSFTNDLVQYDDFKAGPLFRQSSLTPFSIKVDSFDVKFETGNVQRGAAREFKAVVTVTDRPGDKPRQEVLRVNHPLNLAGGEKIHLIAWGYAPIVTVKDGTGNVVYSGPVIFLPQDGNFTSAGAISAPDARPRKLGFEGFFLPSAYMDSSGPRSVFPDALNPQLFLNAWSGKPTAETGQPQSVYSLNTRGMSQIMNPKDPKQPLRFILRPGYIQKLPNGQGSIQLDGVQRWIKIQVGDSPGAPITLVAIGTAVLGLSFSLFIRPRRIWARIRRVDDHDLLEVAGLDRADARTGLTEDVEALANGIDRQPATRNRTPPRRGSGPAEPDSTTDNHLSKETA
ncbi:cytochrome c biogenesis protein ResB [Brachybacterium sp. ACRRE]|uniref:cytochrome c biogenesis protein ResB n=1 Tax=Brachybacterium sp. ACRRE TaxID=2918184 RepID=UPI001EF2E896|nr:cytochrome c biogenesis protein ResB [Brachybacterium sp. ACRRE]